MHLFSKAFLQVAFEYTVYSTQVLFSVFVQQLVTVVFKYSRRTVLRCQGEWRSLWSKKIKPSLSLTLIYCNWEAVKTSIQIISHSYAFLDHYSGNSWKLQKKYSQLSLFLVKLWKELETTWWLQETLPIFPGQPYFWQHCLFRTIFFQDQNFGKLKSFQTEKFAEIGNFNSWKAFTCSKSKIGTLDKSVKYVQN